MPRARPCFAWAHRVEGGTAPVSADFIDLFDVSVPAGSDGLKDDWLEASGGFVLPVGTGGAFSTSGTATFADNTLLQGSIAFSQQY